MSDSTPNLDHVQDPLPPSLPVLDDRISGGTITKKLITKPKKETFLKSKGERRNSSYPITQRYPSYLATISRIANLDNQSVTARFLRLMV